MGVHYQAGQGAGDETKNNRPQKMEHRDFGFELEGDQDEVSIRAPVDCRSKLICALEGAPTLNADKSLCVDQKVNLFGQDAGNIPNDVPSEKVNQGVPLRGADDQVRRTHRGGDVHDGVCR